MGDAGRRAARRLVELVGPARLSRIAARLRRTPLLGGAIGALERALSKHLETRGDPARRARTRWLGSSPEPALTWGLELDGDQFVAKAATHGAFGADRVVLEVGPGYGRILRSCIAAEVPFARYIGLELSASNVGHLRASFPEPRIEFVEGDAETYDLGARVDTVLSSLTFKHLYPSFEAALRNVGRQLSERGLLLFDLIEGSRRYFQWDGTTFIREYTRPEVEEMLARASLRAVTFDEVAHDPDHRRLLVVAAPALRPAAAAK